VGGSLPKAVRREAIQSRAAALAHRGTVCPLVREIIEANASSLQNCAVLDCQK